MATYEPKIYRAFHVKTPGGRRHALELVGRMLELAHRNDRRGPKPHRRRNARHGRPRGR